MNAVWIGLQWATIAVAGMLLVLVVVGALDVVTVGHVCWQAGCK